jgi:2'-5' RNA ligase
LGHGSESSRSKKVDASVGRAASAVKASKDADYLEGQAAAFDRGEINAQGRSINEGSTRRSDKRAAAQRRREERILKAKKQRGDKPAWQVSPDVWADSTGNLGGGARDLILAEHRDAVEAAVRDGKDVPADVRQAYPDLAAAEPPREFSSTQVELPPAISSKLRQLADSIPDSELGEDGREDAPHVTVKFGLHTNDIADVRRVLAGEAPITLTFGKTSLFPAKEGADYDVVKVDVDSPDLHRLNAKIAGALEHTDTHPDYKPHATIAYVKAGLGRSTRD